MAKNTRHAGTDVEGYLDIQGIVMLKSFRGCTRGEGCSVQMKPDIALSLIQQDLDSTVPRGRLVLEGGSWLRGCTNAFHVSLDRGEQYLCVGKGSERLVESAISLVSKCQSGSCDRILDHL